MKTKYLLPILFSVFTVVASFYYFNKITKLFLVNTIAIQPLGYISNRESLDSLQILLKTFYKKRVVILHAIPLNSKYIDLSKGLRYDAEKIIKELASADYKRFDKVIGFTESDIFMYRAVTKQTDLESMEINDAWGIFGLGDKPGKSCVVSSYRLQDVSDSLTLHRIETVAKHEIGHTMGLDHCRRKGCVMNGSYHSVMSIDSLSGAYCKKCDRHLLYGY